MSDAPAWLDVPPIGNHAPLAHNLMLIIRGHALTHEIDPTDRTIAECDAILAEHATVKDHGDPAERAAQAWLRVGTFLDKLDELMADMPAIAARPYQIAPDLRAFMRDRTINMFVKRKGVV